MKMLRKVLAESGVGAVAIAVLLFWSLEAAAKFISQGGAGVLLRFGLFIATAVAIAGMPFIPDRLDVPSRVLLFTIGWQLMMAVGCYAAAYVLSKSVFEIGPAEYLRTLRNRLRSRNA